MIIWTYMYPLYAGCRVYLVCLVCLVCLKRVHRRVSGCKVYPFLFLCMSIMILGLRLVRFIACIW